MFWSICWWMSRLARRRKLLLISILMCDQAVMVRILVMAYSKWKFNTTHALSNIMSVIVSCHFFFTFVFVFDFDLFNSIIWFWLFLYAIVCSNSFVFVTSVLFLSALLYLTSLSASIVGWSSFKNTVKASWTSCSNFSWSF